MRMIDRSWLRGEIRRSDRNVFRGGAVAPEVDERIHGISNRYLPDTGPERLNDAGDLVTGHDGEAILTIARRPGRRPRQLRGRDRRRMDTHERASFARVRPRRILVDDAFRTISSM
jgi:hypothetical protein